MTTATQIVLTEAQIAALDDGKLITIPADWEEFMEFLPTTRYKAEFINNEIIIMGLAILIHEWVVIHVSYLLKLLYQGRTDMMVLGSNLGVSRPEKSYFNPDITVIKGQPNFYESSKAIVKNPYLVVEIISEGTANYDWNTKMPRYQRIESLQEIVIIDPIEKSVSVISRTADPKVWTMTNYDQPTETVLIDGNTLMLNAFFEGMPQF